jgi:hypothetical protein
MHRLTAIDVKLLTETTRRSVATGSTIAPANCQVATHPSYQQFGEDGTEYNAHELDYFDDVGTLTADTLNGFRASDAVSAGGMV